MKIAIVGLGYAGLPLALQFARSGAEVIGLDIDPLKIEALASGRSYIQHISDQAIADCLKGGQFSPTSDFNHIKDVDAVIICVPTPLTRNREPDISYILQTGR